MVLSSFNQIAVPGVYLLIFFLGYPSQVLFYYLEPAPLTREELWISNVVLVLIFVTYTKSVFVDPGRIPKSYGKDFGKKFATGSSVTKVPGGGEEVTVQGDLSDDILEYIEENYKDVPEDNIELIEDKKKKKAETAG